MKFLPLAAAAATDHTALWMFLAFVAATLIITYFSARKTSGASSYFAAGRRITGWQNGLAVAGEVEGVCHLGYSCSLDYFCIISHLA
jgi:Na+(H+)/acetate symporter ActP